MGWLVLKVNPDPTEDRWCLWSTIAEGPVFDGTEAELTRYYLFQEGEQRRVALTERIERAKVHGAGTNWDGDWDDPDAGMTLQQRGILPRLQLGALLDLYARNADESEVQALLIPFEDEEETHDHA